MKSHLHAKQRAVDNDWAQLRVLIWGRRSGKTEYLTTTLLNDGLPGEVSAFVAPTLARAKDILYPQLERYAKKYGITLVWQRQRGRILCPNGAIIQLFGLHSRSEAEKLRGDRFPLVVFDECGAYTDQDVLRYAVQEGADPATADFFERGGRGIILSGTPGPIPEGFFFDCCQGKYAASVHHATIHDNPFFAGRAEKIIEKTLRDKGWTRETPAFLREWMAVWALDRQSLCYGSWDGSFHAIEDVGPGITCLGVDLGAAGTTAFTVGRVVEYKYESDGKRYRGQKAYLLAHFQEAGMKLPAIAEKCHELIRKWDINGCRGDSGGLGGLAITELAEEYGVPIGQADKPGSKRDRIWGTDGKFASGKLACTTGIQETPLPSEFRSLVWNDDRDDHSERQSDHGADSTHYCLFGGFIQWEDVELLPPEPGTPEWLEEQAAKRKRSALARRS
jgi:hypothetical protein